MMSTAADLTAIRDALTDLAFAMVDQTHNPSGGFLALLEILDEAIEGWGSGTPSPEEHYRLGVVLGMCGHMAACRLDSDGSIIALPIDFPENDPVANAVSAVRNALVGFHVPSA